MVGGRLPGIIDKVVYSAIRGSMVEGQPDVEESGERQQRVSHAGFKLHQYQK